MEEADHQPQLPEAELGLVPPRLGHDAVEHAGQIQGLGEVQVLVQRNRPAARQGRVQGVVPDEDLVRPDVRDVERQGDRCVRQVDGLHRGVEVEQPVPLGNLEEPLAELAQHHVLLRSVVLLHEARHAGQVDLEVDLLVAVVLQVVAEGPQVLDAAMPVDLRHAGNRLRQDRMQAGVQREQVPPMGHEAFQVLGFGKVQSAGQTGQDHPQAENVGQRVVMADQMLPGHITGKVDGLGDFGGTVPDREIGHLPGAVIRVGRATGLRNDGHGQGAGGFDAVELGRIASRLQPAGLLEPDPDAVHVQGIQSFQRRHAARGMGIQDLAHQRQEAAQRVFRRETARFQPCTEVFVKGAHLEKGLVHLGQ